MKLQHFTELPTTTPDRLTEAQQLEEKPLSFNNLLGSDCAYRTAHHIGRTTNNPRMRYC